MAGAVLAPEPRSPRAPLQENMRATCVRAESPHHSVGQKGPLWVTCSLFLTWTRYIPDLTVRFRGILNSCSPPLPVELGCRCGGPRAFSRVGRHGCRCGLRHTRQAPSVLWKHRPSRRRDALRGPATPGVSASPQGHEGLRPEVGS